VLLAEPVPRPETSPAGTNPNAPAETDPDQAEAQRRRASRKAWEFERSRLRTRAGLRRSAEELAQSLAIRWESLPRRIAPGTVPLIIHAVPDSLSTPLALELASERAERVAVVERLWDRLLGAERVRAGVLIELVDELIDQMLRHPDRFAAVALGASRGVERTGAGQSVAAHAYATATLSVAIAIRLGWSVWDARAAGLAGLMADSGMLLLPTDLRAIARPLTEVEWNAMRRHPAYSMALCSHVLEMPEIVPLAVYQHHEREDGSGYPLGLKTFPNSAATSPICDLAKVVAVADVLAGASAHRAHRPRSTAHAAVQLVVRQAAAGVLDKQVVRAAVRAVGVFPAGSYVRLNTGDVGIVEGVRDPDRADRPVVRLVETDLPSGGYLELKPDLIDLADAHRTDVNIVAALDVPQSTTRLAAV
jgi:HD-GYP domain-containing protein (c-di-GMP phosphodiesterase class II)